MRQRICGQQSGERKLLGVWCKVAKQLQRCDVALLVEAAKAGGTHHS